MNIQISNSTPSTIAPTEVPAGMGSSQADGVFPRRVRHFRGETRLAQAPTRIAVLATGELDSAVLLGCIPAGSTFNDPPALVPAYLFDSFPQHRAALDAITPLGSRTAPDMTALAALQPDLIVGTQGGAHLRLAPELEAIAPTILMEGHGLNWKQDFLLFAQALGRRAQAEQAMAHYAARVAALAQKLATAGLGGQTVSFARFGPKGLETYGSHAFIDVIARDLGLARPATQRFPAAVQTLSADALDQIDGDWLFHGATAHPAALAARADTRECWHGLRAVQRGRAISVVNAPWFGNASPVAAGIVLDALEAALLAR